MKIQEVQDAATLAVRIVPKLQLDQVEVGAGLLITTECLNEVRGMRSAVATFNHRNPDRHFRIKKQDETSYLVWRDA